MIMTFVNGEIANNMIDINLSGLCLRQIPLEHVSLKVKSHNTGITKIIASQALVIAAGSFPLPSTLNLNEIGPDFHPPISS